jgi:hypothetical protein
MQVNQIESSGLQMIGRLKIEVFDQEGQLKQVQDVPNLVVTAGKNFIAQRMKDAATGVMTHMSIGDGSSGSPGTATAPAVGNTTLGNEKARVALASTSVSGNAVTYSATFAAGTPSTAAAIVEAGLFNAASAGTMLCRTTFAVVNKGTNDTMTITWTVTVS